MNIPIRKDVLPGAHVAVVEKQNQHSNVLTEGIVKRVLTNSQTHPHGIKVQLVNGVVGRVKKLLNQ